MAKFTYDFEGVEKTIRAFRRGIKDGMEESAHTLLDKAQDAAQDRIIQERRIWRHELYSSWIQNVDDLSPTRVDGTLKNYSVHAATIDEGRTPGETAPQVQHIIEWVDDNVNTSSNPTNYGGGDSGGGDDGSFVQQQRHATRRDDVSYDVVGPGVLGLGESVNQAEILGIQYDNDDKGVFKPYDLGDFGSAQGVVENEQVVSKIVQGQNWDEDLGFPHNADITVKDPIDGNLKDGNVQEFVEDAKPLSSAIRNKHKINQRQSPSEFLSENKEWAARVGVIDYIIGNEDRHMENAVVDADGQPWAIDSGGHSFPVMERDANRAFRFAILDVQADLERRNIVAQEFVEPDYQALYAIQNTIIERQREILEQIESDEKFRRELVEFAENLHGSSSEWEGYFEELLSPDSDHRFALFQASDEWDGKKLYQYDLDELKQMVENTYENRKPDEPEETTEHDGIEWNTDHTETLDYDDGTALGMIDDALGLGDDS